MRFFTFGGSTPWRGSSLFLFSRRKAAPLGEGTHVSAAELSGLADPLEPRASDSNVLAYKF